MKKIIWICFLCLVMFLQSCETSYKVKESKGIGEFIIPPDTYWGYKENGQKKYGYDRYYYVLLSGLSKNYLNSISALNQTQSWSGNDDYFEKEFNQLKRKAKDEKVEFSNLRSYKLTSNFFKCAPINNQKSGYLIQIDYDAIICNGSEKQTTENFSALAKELLIKISEKENQYDWPTSISQNIIEKIFEHIPIPQEASLARYSFIQNDRYSFVLLNPKILMMVDVAERIRTRWDDSGIDPKYWQMNYYGQAPVRFFRDQKGEIIQTPFLDIKSKTLPSNSSNNAIIKNSTLQAASADIQLTDGLKKKHFIGVFQYDNTDGFKSNHFNNEDIDLINDNIKGNSQILLFDKLNSIFYNSIDSTEYPSEEIDDIISSSFGSRNLITPSIVIYINGIEKVIPLNSDMSILLQQGNIPSIGGIELLRLYNGKYKKIQFSDGRLKLLPQDKILY